MLGDHFIRLKTRSTMDLSRYRIFLASGSPRRRELLGMLGLQFEILAGGEIDESYPEELPAEEVSAYLSEKKARPYLGKIKDNELLVTADTIVVDKGKVLGKPSTEEEAVGMLKSLSGHTHKVITGVTLSTRAKQTTFSTETLVEFAALSGEEIKQYVAKFKPFDKAGAYGIQEWIGCIGIKSINGCFYNVMGLPLNRLYEELKKF